MSTRYGSESNVGVRWSDLSCLRPMKNLAFRGTSRGDLDGVPVTPTRKHGHEGHGHTRTFGGANPVLAIRRACGERRRGGEVHGQKTMTGTERRLAWLQRMSSDVSDTSTATRRRCYRSKEDGPRGDGRRCGERPQGHKETAMSGPSGLGEARRGAAGLGHGQKAEDGHGELLGRARSEGW